MIAGTPAELVTHLNSNRLRLLAVTSDTRLPQFPQTPTVAESSIGNAGTMDDDARTNRRTRARRLRKISHADQAGRCNGGINYLIKTITYTITLDHQHIRRQFKVALKTCFGLIGLLTRSVNEAGATMHLRRLGRPAPWLPDSRPVPNPDQCPTHATGKPLPVYEPGVPVCPGSGHPPDGKQYPVHSARIVDHEMQRDCGASAFLRVPIWPTNRLHHWQYRA